MQLLVTDETNRDPSANVRFFVYGGLVVSFDQLVTLDHAIEEIRQKYGYRPSDALKFETRGAGPHVSPDQAKNAKREVLDLCIRLKLKFIAHIILHDIIKNQEPEQQVLWAADYVIGRFNQYLSIVGDHGMVIVDNLPVKAQWRYLSDRFTVGLRMPGEKTTRLDRIKLFGASCVNGSHAMSAIDVVLGSFRFCINSPKNELLASELMEKVVRIMWHEYDEAKETYHVGRRGLIIRPELGKISNAAYRRTYDDLLASVNRLLEKTGKADS